jgi:acetyl esterase/lipase
MPLPPWFCSRAPVALALAVISLPALHAHAAPAPTPQTVLLWPNGAPGALGDNESDKPRLSLFPVQGNNTGAAVLVLPGGGYQMLAFDREGTNVAEWFNKLGVSAFVLRYRLGPRYHHPIEIGDASRAMRWVRSHAGDYGIDPHRIGVCGFSAGGHLASTLGTRYDSGAPDSPDPIERAASRPDFLILGYPVIDPLGTGSVSTFHALLGDNPDPNLVQQLSTDTQVTAATPPAFLIAASDDPIVSPQNSINFYSALLAHGVSAELHIFRAGGHGFDLAKEDPALSQWTQLLANWLQAEGFLHGK